MHAEAYDFVARTVHGRRFPHVVEFGSRNVNGSVRAEFLASDIYLGLDLVDGDGVDLVGDVAEWSGTDFDAVVCCEVLEHAPLPYLIVEAAHRALKPGGLLILTCATTGRAPHNATDGGDLPAGEHYANVPRFDLERYLTNAGFHEWAISGSITRGDLYCVATA